MPKVSVIIPAFNRADQLSEAIASVLTQSFADYELIVVDDGSTEDLSAVATEVSERRGTFLKLPVNCGVAAARNAGVALSKCDWIAFLDSDDLWLPGKLESQLKFLSANPTIRISQCQEIWYRNGKFVNPKDCHAMPDGDAFAASLKRCCISPSSVILQRSLFEEFTGFDEGLAVCEDYEFWLRITAKYPVPLLREQLVKKFGGHADQLSRSQPAMDRFRAYALVKLLLNADLTDAQSVLAKGELEEKLDILLLGAEKRGHVQAVRLFTQLLAAVHEGIAFTEVEKQAELRAVLPQLLTPDFSESKLAANFI